MPKPNLKVWALLTLAAIAGGVALCMEDPAFEKARTALENFQDGLRVGDEIKLRRSVTSRSREFIAKLPTRPESKPLQVREQRREHSRIYLDVYDPSPDAPVREGRFVVAKEDGEWLVDLIATAGEGAREVATGPVNQQFVPTKMTPEQLREARRAVEASAKRPAR